MEQVLERLLVEIRETRELVRANKETMEFCLEKKGGQSGKVRG
jgi:hypothetical protein